VQVLNVAAFGCAGNKEERNARFGTKSQGETYNRISNLYCNKQLAFSHVDVSK
jgi:hypothetical protein